MQYVGIPFHEDGPAVDGHHHCWSLVRLFLSEEFGLDLPAYGETPVSDLSGTQNAVTDALASGTWRRIDRAEALRGDVVVMTGVERVNGRMSRTRRHVGVMVDNKRVLHVETGTDSVIVPLSDVSVRGRIDSFWRHRDLA